MAEHTHGYVSSRKTWKDNSPKERAFSLLQNMVDKQLPDMLERYTSEPYNSIQRHRSIIKI